MTEWMTIVLLCGWLSLLSRKSIRGRINSSWRGWWGWRGWWCRSYPAGWCGWRWRFVLHLKLLQALFRSLGLVRSRKPGKYMGNKKIIIYIYMLYVTIIYIYILYSKPDFTKAFLTRSCKNISIFQLLFLILVFQKRQPTLQTLRRPLPRSKGLKWCFLTHDSKI